MRRGIIFGVVAATAGAACLDFGSLGGSDDGCNGNSCADASTGNDASIDGAVEGATAAADFSIALGVVSARVDAGASVGIPVTVTRKGSFSAPITISVNGLPPQLTASPLIIVGDADTLTLNAATDALGAAGLITVVGTADNESATAHAT
ncbi:MAG: hypothetical protein ACRELY_11560, partial [Polyangiaceae bacterium]